MSKKKLKKEKKVQSARSVKARAFFKRYWYWFVVIPVLIGGILGWCGAMGYFDAEKDFELEYSEITIAPLSYYKLSNYVGQEKASYYVASGYEDIMSLKNNVLFAKKEGTGKLVVSNGSQSKEMIITVSPYASTWRLGVGDLVLAEEVDNFADAVFNNVNGVINHNTEVFNTEINEGVMYYRAKQEGMSMIYYSVDGVDVMVVTIFVSADYTEKDKFYPSDYEFTTGNNEFYDKPNITSTENITVGTDMQIDEFNFSGSGFVYYESSDTSVAKVYQDGTVKTENVGTAQITIACIAENGTEYYSIKLNVETAKVNYYADIETNSRNPYVGEVILVSELYRFGYHDNIASVDTEYNGYMEKIVVDGEEAFRLLKSTDGREITIDALSKDGKKLISYIIIIENDNAEDNGE